MARAACMGAGRSNSGLILLDLARLENRHKPDRWIDGGNPRDG
jgi:hypothetical protein